MSVSQYCTAKTCYDAPPIFPSTKSTYCDLRIIVFAAISDRIQNKVTQKPLEMWTWNEILSRYDLKYLCRIKC